MAIAGLYQGTASAVPQCDTESCGFSRRRNGQS